MVSQAFTLSSNITHFLPHLPECSRSFGKCGIHISFRPRKDSHRHYISIFPELSLPAHRDWWSIAAKVTRRDPGWEEFQHCPLHGGHHQAWVWLAHSNGENKWPFIHVCSQSQPSWTPCCSNAFFLLQCSLKPEHMSPLPWVGISMTVSPRKSIYPMGTLVLETLLPKHYLSLKSPEIHKLEGPEIIPILMEQQRTSRKEKTLVGRGQDGAQQLPP